jgi:hypothetical protein
MRAMGFGDGRSQAPVKFNAQIFVKLLKFRSMNNFRVCVEE